jgi:hypothetical protein
MSAIVINWSISRCTDMQDSASLLDAHVVTAAQDLSILFKMEQDPGFIAAVEEAKQGLSEGGVPIGAALVSKATE